MVERTVRNWNINNKTTSVFNKGNTETSYGYFTSGLTKVGTATCN